MRRQPTPAISCQTFMVVLTIAEPLHLRRK